jgi:endonuclease/exonuclease/phosphatase (EEP) superfamily protein YafD
MDRRHGYNIKNFQHVQVETRSNFHLINHHGYHVEGSKEGNAETLKQMQAIKKYISGLKGPVIMSGDFNLSPNSESIKVFDDVLVNLSREQSIVTTRNELSSRPVEVCDYIFVSTDVKVTSFSVSESIVSDHRALILEFEI